MRDPDPAVFIDAPRHRVLQQLLAYWTRKRGARPAASRADIRPAEIKTLLPDVMMWNVERSPFTIRLVGGNVVAFVGRDNTGREATAGMPDEGARAMTEILNRVAGSMTPLFRTGKAFWHAEKAYRDFEACYLPLSDDGKTVTVILGGVKFDVGDPATA